MEKNLLQVKRLLFTLIVLAFSTSYLHAQVAINEDGSTPDASAMLDVKSADKGLLIPRLTTAARTTLGATAVAGLMVWDTDLNKFFFFNGTIWKEGSTGGLWSENVSGNSYLTNSSGMVGIGTQYPSFHLDILNGSGPSWIRTKSVTSSAGFILDKASKTDKGYIMFRTAGVNKWFAGTIGSNNFSISTQYDGTGNEFFIDTTGRVGIGTANPVADLEVEDVDGETEIRISRPDLSFASQLMFSTGGTAEWRVTAVSGSPNMSFSRGAGNTTGNMGLVTGGGFVGIGTLYPARTLEVKGGERTARFTSSSSSGYLEFVTTNTTDWAIGSTIGTMRIQSSTDGFATSTDRYIFGSGFFHPYSNNVRSLGLSAYRWSTLYSVAGDFSGNVNVAGNTYIGDTLGVGTTSPARTFEVVGPWRTARLSSSSGGATLEFVDTNQDDWAVTTWAGNMAFLSSTDDFATKTDEFFFTTSSFYPNTNNVKMLGLSNKRWSNVYSVAGNFNGAGSGIAGATVYSVNTGTSGIAGYFETTGTDATLVMSQNGTGKFLKAFGPNGGNEELSINNDGTISIYNSSYTRTILIDPSESGTTDGGQITMYNATGTATIEIDGSYGGDGRITTQELQITGGSDLSEFFDLTAYEDIQKGMVVSIDENNPGHLVISKDAYDKKVAGIISGANNIEPGLIMSQKGTIADGEHLVALSGRVYCMVDASSNPVMIGDMLTTSSQPGHAMKVDDFEKARGAIIGKAMTSLESGKGLVLVLVSLQ